MHALQPDNDADLRGLMFSIAYRMTGSLSDAEDLVQDAYFRLERARQGGAVVESPKAYLAAATTRLAIDHMRSARARRESYVGTWLPEPIVTDLQDSPEQMAELSDSLSLAFLVLLESLSPVERAVFLLRDVFDYQYEEIAQIVEKSEANCRQIFVRARRHLDAHHARYEVSTEQSESLLRSFLAAARDGDFEQLVELLATDAAFYGDGGGKATATSQPLFGRDRVATFVLDLFERAKGLGVSIEPVHVNGGPGLVTYDPKGKLASVISLEVLDGIIQTVRGIVNPDKLRHLGPVSDIARIRPDEGEDPEPGVPRNQFGQLPAPTGAESLAGAVAIEEEPMSTDQEAANKAIVTRFENALSSRDWDVISRTIDDLVEPDALIRSPIPTESQGAEKLKEIFSRLHRAYPDLQVTADDLIAEGDKVVARNTCTCTHQGEYMGIAPTGNTVTYNEIFIVRIVDGRIVETWGVVDVLSQMKKLGAIPA
jgi:RNA polymerase sigma-70 factor (ECF subfamily)